MTELISKNIRSQRIAQGMTQEELAAKVFTTRQTISNYETGKSKPDYEMIGKIATALGVNAETLLYDIGDQRKKIKMWCIALGTAFLFVLARSAWPLLNKFGSPILLTYGNGYITVIIPAVCCILGWVLVRFYELYIHKHELHFRRSRTILILLVLILGVWFLAALWDIPQIYEAVSDPNKNQYGGPAMLGVYLETFYYKYIVIPFDHLPILNSIFVFLGSIFAVCINGEKQ